MPYCTSADLLIDSQLGFPNGIDPEKYVQFGADRIDMTLGRVYKTPIVFETTRDRDTYSATIQLLKVVNQHISSGMLINAISLSGVEQAPNGYGAYLISEGQKVLELICEGGIILEGVEPSPNKPQEGLSVSSRPSIYNEDAKSATEAFYDMVWSGSPNFVPLMPRNLFGNRG